MKNTAIEQLSEEQLASLIEENMGLVVKLAKTFNPKNEDELEEYIQLGRIGLWKAMQKYDGTRAKFSTYAWRPIRWEILRYLSKKKRPEAQLDETFDVEDRSVDIQLWEVLPEHLTSNEIKVLELKLEGKNFVEIGKDMGKSRGWANNIYKTAIEKILDANKEKTHSDV